MEYIIAVLVFMLKTVYSTLPGVAANVAPFVFRKVPFLNYPIDFGLQIKGKPVLGPNKTFRGLLSGVLFAMLVMYGQFALWHFFGFNFHLVDFETINFHLLGFLMGFGVIFGDSFESFLKRRLNIPPSSSLIPWDQIDSVLGGLIFGWFAWKFPWQYGVTAVTLTFVFHIGIRHLLYYLKVTDKKW